jgi:hypothetical protein
LKTIPVAGQQCNYRVGHRVLPSLMIRRCTLGCHTISNSPSFPSIDLSLLFIAYFSYLIIIMCIILPFCWSFFSLTFLLSACCYLYATHGFAAPVSQQVHQNETYTQVDVFALIGAPQFDLVMISLLRITGKDGVHPVQFCGNCIRHLRSALHLFSHN